MTNSVYIKVYHADGYVSEPPHPRPLRRLPDGGYGVTYDGHVFPLFPGHRICLRGSRFDKSSCPSSGHQVDLEEYFECLQRRLCPSGWHIADLGSGLFRLSFNGNEDKCALLNELLKRCELGYGDSHASFSVAEDGYFYDWCVLLASDLTYENLYASVDCIVNFISDQKLDDPNPPERSPRADGAAPADRRSTPPTPVSITDATDEVSALRSELISLRQRYDPVIAERSDLEDEILTLRHELHQLKLLNANLEEVISKNRMRHSDLEASLRREISELQSALATRSASGRDSSVRRALNEAIASGSLMQRQLDDMSTKLSDLERDNDDVRTHLEDEKTARRSAEERIRYLSGRVQELEFSTDGAREKSRQNITIKNVFDAIFKRIGLDNLSLAVVEESFSYLDKLVDILGDLNEDRGRHASRRMTGTQNWFEVQQHIATGRNDQGRVYWRPRNDKDERKLHVWIRMKNTQGKDFERMGRLDC